MIARFLFIIFSLIAMTACVRNQPQVVVITATFLPPTEQLEFQGVTPEIVTSIPPASTIPAQSSIATSGENIVQAGDKLSDIAIQ